MIKHQNARIVTLRPRRSWSKGGRWARLLQQATEADTVGALDIVEAILDGRQPKAMQLRS
jgi:hypothetical protein